MDSIRTFIMKVLDRADRLLTSEPARMIGYGAAVVVYLVVRALGELKPGLIPAMGFGESVGVAFSALATVVILIESIRRFVYSPLTYIEDLSDESQAAHEAAHLEEDLHRWTLASIPPPPEPKSQTIAVGYASSTGDKVVQ